MLTHWGTHICVGSLTIIGSDNGLSPGRHQAIIWTNAGILSIGPLGTNFGEILIEINAFSFKKMHLKNVCKMASILSRPQCIHFAPFLMLPCVHLLSFSLSSRCSGMMSVQWATRGRRLGWRSKSERTPVQLNKLREAGSFEWREASLWVTVLQQVVFVKVLWN